jgi:hypothetical protein
MFKNKPKLILFPDCASKYQYVDNKNREMGILSEKSKNALRFEI